MNADAKKYESWAIRYRFLGGNLFEGWEPDALAGIDRAASVVRYAELVKGAIEAEYPGAKVEVGYEGHLVSGGSGHEIEVVPADEDTLPLEYERDVEEIAGRVTENEDWYVK